MKISVGIYVLASMLGLMVTGCSTSESEPSDESPLAEKALPFVNHDAALSLTEDHNDYVRVVEGQLVQLQHKHVKLVDRAQQIRLGSESQAAFETNLNALTRKVEEIHKQIKALKAGTKKDWLALRLGMNLALEELTYSYDIALAQFAG